MDFYTDYNKVHLEYLEFQRILADFDLGIEILIADLVELVEIELKNLALNYGHLSYAPWATEFDQKTRGMKDISVDLAPVWICCSLYDQPDYFPKDVGLWVKSNEIQGWSFNFKAT